MRRYLSLWAELMRLSWRCERGLTAASLAAIAGSLVVVAAIGLSLRAVVDATVEGGTAAAMLAAVGVALAFAADVALRDVSDTLIGTTVDRVARLEVHPRVHRDIAALAGLEHLERSDFADRVTLVRASTGALQRGTWTAVTAVANVGKLAVTLALLGTVSPWLVLLLVFAAVPVWCDHRGLTGVTRAELETAEVYRLQQHLFELTMNAASAKEIRVALAGDEIVRRQGEAWHEAMDRRLRAQVGAAAWKLLGWSVFAVGFVGGLALVAYRTANGNGTVGDLVLAVTIAATVRQSLRAAVASTAETAGAGRLVEPYLWLRDYVAAHARTAATAPAPSRLREGITLDDVTFAYPGTDRLAVDHVSVHLPAGSVVAIVGEYGSGKTSLVKLLNTFYQPDSGTITVDGVPLSRLDTEDWRARTSAVFQDFGRFRTTFATTVGLGDLSNMDNLKVVSDAVTAAEADQIVATLPDGPHTQLGRELGGVDLSEGQWQRTALARACMRTGPLLFVLDEPTASLDAPSEQGIFERHMERARRFAVETGAVTVIVSHRFSTVTGADLILVLDSGRLVEEGSHDDLIALGGRYADLYGMQAAAYAPTGASGPGDVLRSDRDPA